MSQSTFSVRNVNCDHYCEQVSEVTRTVFPNLHGRVPTLRIFGLTSEGEKCCVHIHGVFPYIWMRTKSSLNLCSQEQLNKMLTNILKQTPVPCLDPEGPVVAINEHEAKSIYGYSQVDDHFVQLQLRDPRYVKLIAYALQKGAMSNYLLQPYYAHVPYILQFFIDYDISGMGWIHFDLNHIQFRTPPLNFNNSFKKSPLKPTTNMKVEFDAFTVSIKNSFMLSQTNFVNLGLQLIYADEADRRGGEGATLPASTPPGIRDICSISPREQKMLDEFKAFINKTSSQPTSFTEAVSFNSFDVELHSMNETITHQTFQQSMNTIANIYANTTKLNNGDMDFFDINYTTNNELWDDMEMETRGFEDENEEELDGNEEIVTDSEEDEDQAPDGTDFIIRPEEEEKFQTEDLVEPNAHELCADKLQVMNPQNESSYADVGFVKQRPPRKCLRLIHDVTLSSDMWTQPQKVSSPKSQSQTCLLHSNVCNLCAMAIEVLALPITADKGVADPVNDPILAVSVAVVNDVINWDGKKFDFEISIAISIPPRPNTKNTINVDSEKLLLDELVKVVKKFDPELLIGYDLQRGSWYYVCERASIIRHNFAEETSRVKGKQFQKFHSMLTGRIKLETWYMIKRESQLRSYDFGYAVSALLKQPMPSLYVADLIKIRDSEDPYSMDVLNAYFLNMARYDLILLHTLQVYVRTSQMAQIYGIQYSEVINRGSQFRVESMLLRIAKKEWLLPPSVGIEQRNRMGAPETVPLNLEPESGIYRDPVAVLDFQSLYPSILIAYNYCFSTSLGKIKRLCEDTKEPLMTMGGLKYERLSTSHYARLVANNLIHVAPTGCAFVKESVRKSLLAQMLQELLDTRVMIKKSMKLYKNNKKIYSQLEAQQLALKLAANTTFGYTAANWSGRMPMEEVAEAIVSKARETLEKVVEMIDTAPPERYANARVIYGDTDSIFILFEGEEFTSEGSTRSSAFQLANQIADEVTNMNPYPMNLKFEKIMQPCVLETKKRYVGNSYENDPNEVPKLDAKGIETVRRDQCELVSNLMEKFLKVLFAKNEYAAMQYLNARLKEIHRFPYANFVINTKYHGGYAEHAKLPTKKIADERAKRSELYAPKPGERVSYVVVHRPHPGQKSVKLINCVASLEEFIGNPDLRLHYNYYVTRPIFSAIGRVLQLVPITLRWHLIHTNRCYACLEPNKYPLCERCSRDVNVFQRLVSEKILCHRDRSRQINYCRQCIAPDVFVRMDFVSCANMNCSINETRLRTLRCAAPHIIDKHNFYVANVDLTN